MTTAMKDYFNSIIPNDRKFIEELFVVENKARQIVPFTYNDIQADVDSTETGMDIWVKPAQVGFSTERIAKRLKDTLTSPGTNTVLVAYSDFITERLLNKVNFFYNHLAALGIPNFPEIHHDSTYEKTFRFFVDGKLHSTSSIYIASARSYVAGRAETIHHLLFDEAAFYPASAMVDIISPALDRVPPDGTVDIYSTPNGEDNDFHDMYSLAKEGKSVFTAHLYTWFMHKEYVINLGDPRIKKFIPETDKEEFKLDHREEELMANFNLTFSQIRWRRWKIREKESLRRSGEIALLFQQEFAEDDVSCFLATGDSYYDIENITRLAKSCYPAPRVENNLHIWYPPEEKVNYIVSIDPGQAKFTQSAITVITLTKDEFGNIVPKYCARDAGLYSPEVTASKAERASRLYNKAMITWEANSHGLAITELLKNYRPIYYRKDIVSGYPSMVPGWYTSGGTKGTKDYMLQQVHRYLPDLICHDIELVRQLRHFRRVGDKLEIIGADDIHDSFAIALACSTPKKAKRGLIGQIRWSALDRRR